MKVIIEFDKYEDQHELEVALNGVLKDDVFSDVWHNVFREYYKNGIPDDIDKETLFNHLVHKFNMLWDKEAEQ